MRLPAIATLLKLSVPRTITKQYAAESLKLLSNACKTKRELRSWKMPEMRRIQQVQLQRISHWKSSWPKTVKSRRCIRRTLRPKSALMKSKRRESMTCMRNLITSKTRDAWQTRSKTSALTSQVNFLRLKMSCSRLSSKSTTWRQKTLNFTGDTNWWATGLSWMRKKCRSRWEFTHKVCALRLSKIQPILHHSGHSGSSRQSFSINSLQERLSTLKSKAILPSWGTTIRSASSTSRNLLKIIWVCLIKSLASKLVLSHSIASLIMIKSTRIFPLSSVNTSIAMSQSFRISTTQCSMRPVDSNSWTRTSWRWSYLKPSGTGYRRRLTASLSRRRKKWSMNVKLLRTMTTGWNVALNLCTTTWTSTMIAPVSASDSLTRCTRRQRWKTSGSNSMRWCYHLRQKSQSIGIWVSILLKSQLHLSTTMTKRTLTGMLTSLSRLTLSDRIGSMMNTRLSTCQGMRSKWPKTWLTMSRVMMRLETTRSVI